MIKMAVHRATMGSLDAALARDLALPSPIEQELLDFLYDNRYRLAYVGEAVEYLWDAAKREPKDPEGVISIIVLHLRNKGFVIDRPYGRMRLLRQDGSVFRIAESPLSLVEIRGRGKVNPTATETEVPDEAPARRVVNVAARRG